MRTEVVYPDKKNTALHSFPSVQAHSLPRYAHAIGAGYSAIGTGCSVHALGMYEFQNSSQDRDVVPQGVNLEYHRFTHGAPYGLDCHDPVDAVNRILNGNTILIDEK